MIIGESRIPGADTWKAPPQEALQDESSRITAEADLKGKIIDAKSILEAAKSPEDLKNELDTFKTPAELQPLYTELTLKYGRSTDNDEMDALEPILDALKDKMKSLREGPSVEAAPVVEVTPEATVEIAGEVAKEQPGENQEKPKNNVIDRAAEFTLRKEINDMLTSATKLGVEMFGQYSALTQGNKILPEARRAISDIRTKIDLKKLDKVMRSDMIKSFEVLSSGIYNQKQEQRTKQPRGYDDLLTAFDEVKNFISELKESGAQSEEVLDRAKVA
jgi:hypothetical protein